MAVVRARTSPPYALIIFVFLWVVSTALAVIFYMQYDKAQVAAADAEKAALRLAKKNESSIVNGLIEGQTTDSAVGAANKQILLLRQKIDGGRATVGELVAPETGTIAKAVASVGKPDTDLLSALTALNADIAARTKRLGELEAQVKTLEENYKTAKASSDSRTSTAETSLGQRQDELAKAIAEANTARTERDALATKYENTLTQVKEASEQVKREYVLKLAAAQEEITKLNNKIAAQDTIIKNLRPDLATNVGREPDGTIVRASTGTNECYISLGKKDRVVPGLRFAVHDPKLGVRFATDAEAKGKGGIEVLEVGEVESLCRISHVEKGQRIQPGDLISNPVYNIDKNRKFRFVVFGDFDLDGDGQRSSTERERIITLIKEWGGVVEDSLTSQTDFLVVGTRPSLAMGKYEGAELDGSVAKAQEEKQKTYDDILAEAKRSSVPILNANRFLAMVGYYNTTIVRH